MEPYRGGDEVLSHIVTDTGALRVLKEKSVCLNDDAVHGAHPNWPETNDPDHQPIVGRGISTERDPQADLAHPSYIALARAVARPGRTLQIAAEPDVVAVSADDKPYIETRTGITVGEVGIPVLAMHGVKEFGAIADIEDSLQCSVMFTLTHRSGWSKQNILPK
jgi:aspartyl aminopeptidase